MAVPLRGILAARASSFHKRGKLSRAKLALRPFEPPRRARITFGNRAQQRAANECRRRTDSCSRSPSASMRGTLAGNSRCLAHGSGGKFQARRLRQRKRSSSAINSARVNPASGSSSSFSSQPVATAPGTVSLSARASHTSPHPPLFARLADRAKAEELEAGARHPRRRPNKLTVYRSSIIAI